MILKDFITTKGKSFEFLRVLKIASQIDKHLVQNKYGE